MFSAKWSSKSNSRAVSTTCSPSAVTSRRSGSTVTAPTLTGSSPSRPGCSIRRSTARTRADELTRREGLGDVVVGAELEAEHPVDLVVACRDDDDRDVAPAAELAADLDAVEAAGEAEVEEDEHGALVGDDLEAPHAVGRLQHAKAGVAEVQVEEVRDVAVVLDDEDRPVAVVLGAVVVRHRPSVARREAARDRAAPPGRPAHSSPGAAPIRLARVATILDEILVAHRAAAARFSRGAGAPRAGSGRDAARRAISRGRFARRDGRAAGSPSSPR